MLNEKDTNKNALLEIAKKMMVAARTAPKGRGIDHLEIAIAEQENIEAIARKMKEIGDRLNNGKIFHRDAENILKAPVMMIIGTSISSFGLEKCGMCGFRDCDEKNHYPDIPCAFNTGDLGIAIGSAVSIAMDNRVDNRIMYTVGQALIELNTLGDDIKIAYGIPLSATGKNPFFDRKPK